MTGLRARPLTAQKFFYVNFLLEISSMLIFVLYMFLSVKCLNFSKKKEKKNKSTPTNFRFLKYNGKFPLLCFFFFFSRDYHFFLFPHQLWSFVFNLPLVSTLQCKKNMRDRNFYKIFVPRVGSVSLAANDTKVFFRQFSRGTFFYVDFCFIYVSNGKLSELFKTRKRKK